MVAVGDADGAHHHQEACHGLSRAVPPLVLRGRLGSDGQLHLQRVAALDDNLVLVYHLIFNRIATAFGCLGGDDEPLGLLVVRHGECRVGTQGQFGLVGVLVLGEGFFLLGGLGACGTGFTCGAGFTCPAGPCCPALLGDGFLEAVVGLLEEGEVVVERLHVQISVDVDLTVVGDGITQVRTILQLCTAHPVVSGIIGSIGIEPVQDGQLVERQLIAGGEGLAVVQGRTEMLDALPYRVLPRLVAVGVEVLVDGQIAVGFFDFGLRARLEVHVEVPGQVPAQGEGTVPEEGRAPRRSRL